MRTVTSILAHYRATRNAGVCANLHRMLMHGALGGTGYMYDYPVDQGIEHGPGRSFLPNHEGFDPEYHVKFALEAGMSAHAAPLGQLEAIASMYAGRIPLILKANCHTGMMPDADNPLPVQIADIDDALRLGCAAIGYTIYPGSSGRNEQRMYAEVSRLISAAHRVGLPVVVWSYPRGQGIEKGKETTMDVSAYAAHMAAQLGADIIKVKPPTTPGIGITANLKAYANAMDWNLIQRVYHVVQSAFNGKIIVIFSGGEKKNDDNEIVAEIERLIDGGGFGSIMGRNLFQRDHAAALNLAGKVVAAYMKAAA